MRTSRYLIVVAALLAGRAAIAQETVGVSGSDVKYPTARQIKVGDKPVKLKLTGAGMRKKVIFNVYTVACYIQDDFTGKSAEDLASCDTFKQLHLVLQRSVSGEDMAKAFREAIRANHGDDFADELDKLTALIKAYDVEKGDQVWISYYPGYGLNVNLVGKRAEFIKGTKFGKAVWDIYLGPKNVGENVKKALVSRL